MKIEITKVNDIIRQHVQKHYANSVVMAFDMTAQNASYEDIVTLFLHLQRRKLLPPDSFACTGLLYIELETEQQGLDILQDYDTTTGDNIPAVLFVRGEIAAATECHLCEQHALSCPKCPRVNHKLGNPAMRADF